MNNEHQPIFYYPSHFTNFQDQQVLTIDFGYKQGNLVSDEKTINKLVTIMERIFNENSYIFVISCLDKDMVTIREDLSHFDLLNHVNSIEPYGHIHTLQYRIPKERLWEFLQYTWKGEYEYDIWLYSPKEEVSFDLAKFYPTNQSCLSETIILLKKLDYILVRDMDGLYVHILFSKDKKDSFISRISDLHSITNEY
ncbi:MULTISPECIES: hypothetical protein [Aneurinibacillus]|uniref:Uncharacterized protein n=1 Tax=Aneurinibacillus thermoaerophilus TaxID=143495 RepID=A0A1G8CCB9_ANETH|nr:MULTISPECIES: hypothetical protein [Aneurinibacillus]AMA71587.1 hypothetical protein ACH33_01205 [Aneurinibacillus sp. XH2]MED0675424.1 hypothetical protein [Aneurinibacillus thermoaerophilus]MED0681217.1 hypothetical protein [Aneurinibacillus thermoaerophilus]MED0735457.1 hypothetical protein [Aneurinibacillus thermoaerophilus]MED0757292.1 hypothetical protein [Aneurinibacillus thermoaerophilus]